MLKHVETIFILQSKYAMSQFTLFQRGAAQVSQSVNYTWLLAHVTLPNLLFILDYAIKQAYKGAVSISLWTFHNRLLQCQCLAIKDYFMYKCCIISGANHATEQTKHIKDEKETGQNWYSFCQHHLLIFSLRMQHSLHSHSALSSKCSQTDHVFMCSMEYILSLINHWSYITGLNRCQFVLFCVSTLTFMSYSYSIQYHVFILIKTKQITTSGMIAAEDILCLPLICYLYTISQKQKNAHLLSTVPLN